MLDVGEREPAIAAKLGDELSRVHVGLGRIALDAGRNPVQSVVRATERARDEVINGEAFCSPVFYALALATLGTSLAGTALIFNLAPIMISRELPLTVAARIVSTIGIATIVGRLVGGYLMDRMPAYLLASMAALATLTLPLLLLFEPGSQTAATIDVIVFGLTAGPKTTAIVYLARRQFGSRELGTINGIFNALMASGLALGPLIANAIYDARRSYDVVILGSIPILLIVACLFFLLRFHDVPTRSQQPTGS